MSIRTPSAGFTLAELTVVLIIIGLLLGGLFVPLSAQNAIRYRSDTEKALTDIREALIGFAIANGRLPCPARATAVSGDADNGIEPTPILAAGCANAAGVLPWVTLGVNELDAWGNRYTYRVTPEFTRQAPQTTFNGANCPASAQNSGFALCSQGDMTVLNTVGGTPISSNIPAIVISHGSNGNGAYTSQGTQLAVGGDADELDNQLTAGGTNMANTNLVSKTTTATYDDMLIWISPNILFNRMVSVGKLP
jgi:prepilin-type N-terminal cleavage/methylation domain-containing protein